jgi:hypothetical protein
MIVVGFHKHMMLRRRRYYWNNTMARGLQIYFITLFLIDSPCLFF